MRNSKYSMKEELSEPFLELIIESLPMKIFDSELGDSNRTKNL